jgi:acetyl-CoA carboxylase carboxyltransferase component
MKAPHPPKVPHHPARFEPGGEWQAELQELAQRREQSLAMGGPQALERVRSGGRMDARQRIAALADPDSFLEMGCTAGKGHYDDQRRFVRLDPTNSIVGTARVDGRKVAIHADDYSIRAGSSEATVAEKWIYIERLAHQLRMPLVRLVDSAGGSVKLLMQMGGTKIPGYPTWPANELLKTVPVVGVALGACAGLGAIKVVSSHFSVLVRDQAQVMAAGPHVVRQAYGVEIDKNELGGWPVQRRSAVVHNEAQDEADALQQARRFLSYLPRNVFEAAPVLPCSDDPNRADDWLKDAIPRDRRKIYDPRRILASVLDQGSVFEIGRHQGGSVITALARVNGVPVGVIANDPKVQGGAMTVPAAWKMERHVKLCSQFGLPVVNFVDQPGNATGPGVRAGRHLAGGHAGGRGGARLPVAVAVHHRAALLWHGRRHARPQVRRGTQPPLRLAIGPLGLHPHRRRRDGRPQSRDRSRPRPGGQARRAGSVLPGPDLAVPHGRKVRHSGHHRPARDAGDLVRLGGGCVGTRQNRPHDQRLRAATA